MKGIPKKKKDARENAIDLTVKMAYLCTADHWDEVYDAVDSDDLNKFAEYCEDEVGWDDLPIVTIIFNAFKDLKDKISSGWV